MTEPLRKLVLAIRVYLKKPELLLIEEENIQLDAIQKKSIYGKFWAMECTIMSIVIDLEHILLYDRVYVLDKGRVVEEGDP